MLVKFSKYTLRGNGIKMSNLTFTYDLYFSELEMQDFRSLEEILYIEAMHDDLAMQADREEVCEEVYDDEDDSNDESNWRNDYPDEDPHFLENNVAYVHNNGKEISSIFLYSQLQLGVNEGKNAYASMVNDNTG